MVALHLYLPSALFVESFSIGQTTPSLFSRNLSLNRDAKSHNVPSIGLKPSRYSMVCLQMSSTPFNYGQQQTARQNVRLPLLIDVSENDSQPLYDVPLPNTHLPPELTTASLYELKLNVPIHRSVIQEAISSAGSTSSSPIVEEGCCYGHVVYKPDNADGLVGAIGCASEILIGAPSAMKDEGNMDRDDSGALFVLARGSYRFRVKEIVKSIPYPIAIVDEILDGDMQDETGKNVDDEEEEEDSDIYDTIPSKELIKQIFQCLDKILKAQAEESATPLSPLEKSILEDASSSNPMAQAIQRVFDAEERLAVFQTFTSSLLDIAPGERDRMFAVAMMAGELANLPSDIRVKMLVTMDGVARLRIVLRALSTMVSMDSAKKITKSLSLGGGGDGDGINIDSKSLQEAEDAQKQLKVGTPSLPPWANQIKKGVRVEYYWNEEEEWCLGTVHDDPVKIMDEIIISVKFDDDGSVHKLVFRGDEKARWRPPMGNTGAFD
ncbi:hypothetical protein ACHAXR_004191 [Thalassiosira sp. AJA248-18]